MKLGAAVWDAKLEIQVDGEIEIVRSDENEISVTVSKLGKEQVQFWVDLFDAGRFSAMLAQAAAS